MKKSDMKELRKVVKASDGVVGKVYGLYVDADNNVCYESLKWLSDMDDPERHRHLDILNTVLNPGLGKKTFPVWLKEQNQDLIAMKSAEWPDEEFFAAFRDHLLENYGHIEPYYAVAAKLTYDVPKKSEDNLYLEDGDSVYKSMAFAICPAALEKPILGYEDERVAELARRWTVKKPTLGFLYPSFDEREENRNEAVFFSPAPAAEPLLASLFQMKEDDVPVPLEEQKEMYSNLIDDLSVGMEAAAEISKAIAEKTAEDKESDTVSKEMIRTAARNAGVEISDGDFSTKYENNIGTTRITAPAVIEKSVVFETGDFQLKVPTEKSDLIRSQKVEGVNYILIPIDGDVTVNGVATKLSSPIKTQLVNDIDV